MCFVFGEDVVEIVQWIFVDFEEMIDVWGVGQVFDYFVFGFGVDYGGFYFQVVLFVFDFQFWVQVVQYCVDVFC